VSLSSEYGGVACLWTERTAQNVYRLLKDMRECEMVRDRNALPNANINGVSLRPTMGSKLPRPVFKIFGESGVYKFLRCALRFQG